MLSSRDVVASMRTIPLLFVDADHQLQATPCEGKKKTPFAGDVTRHLSDELVTVDQQDGSCVPARPPQ